MRKLFTSPRLAIALLALGVPLVAQAYEEPKPLPPNLILEGRLPGATVLTVSFGKEGAEPLELTIVGGKVQNGIAISPEQGRRIDLRAENADGKVMYEGTVEIDIGEEFTPQVSLEMKSSLDDAPGELTLASHRVAVQFAAIAREGKSFTRMTADVYDARGLRLELKDDELTWDIDDEWLRENLLQCPKSSGHSLCAEFEPYKPYGDQIALNTCFRDHVCRIEYVPPIPRVWAQITVGMGNHACALKLDGGAYCWGLGQDGQLGVEVAKDCPEWSGPNPPQAWACSGFPVAVVCPNGPCQFTDISAGDSHTCAVDTSGDAWCWGSNRYGELGIGLPSLTAQGSATPLRVATTHKFTSIRAGDAKTCGLTTMGEVYCWGINDLAIVPANSDPTRIVVVPELVDMPTRAPVTAIDLSGNHACALTASGSLFCWGTNGDQAIGPGPFTPAPRCRNCPATPQFMQTSGITDLVMQRVSLVSTGVRGSCAHLTSEQTVCWGRPLPAFGIRAPIERLSRGVAHYCAIGGGALRCAGDGALGDGLSNAAGERGPVAMAGKHRNFREIDTGNYVTCAIGYDEQVYCWGDSSYGSLGLGLGALEVVEPTALLFADLFRLPWPHRSRLAAGE